MADPPSNRDRRPIPPGDAPRDARRTSGGRAPWLLTAAEDRAAAGATAFNAFAARRGGSAPDSAVVKVVSAQGMAELITGLMHLSERYGVNATAMLRRAEQRYHGELPAGAPIEPPASTQGIGVAGAMGESILTGAVPAARRSRYRDWRKLSGDERAEQAAAAVAAYGWRTRDFPGSLSDPAYATELLGDLVSDLHELADQRAVDFETILGEAFGRFKGRNAAEHLPYRVGYLVEIRAELATERRHAAGSGRAQRGWVEAILPAAAGEYRYAVRFPGERSIIQFRADELVPAPAFSPVPTASGMVTSPADAQTQLITLSCQIVRAARTTMGDWTDQQNLLGALAQWSGASRSYIARRLPTTGWRRTGGRSPAAQAATGQGPLCLAPAGDAAAAVKGADRPSSGPSRGRQR